MKRNFNREINFISDKFNFKRNIINTVFIHFYTVKNYLNYWVAYVTAVSGTV